ncbi:MAG: hypothetical protein AB7F65_02570 [Dehalococcoidia bacterium]
MTTTTPIQVHVEPDHLALTLGERASIEVEVFNGSPIVDEFRVDLLGPWIDPIRPEWVTVQPATLALFPNSSGTVLLTLDVPAASQLLAGAHVLGIRVRSMTEPDAAHVAELPLTVSSQPVVSLHLDPQTASGGSSAETKIVARNLGNVPVNLWLQFADPAAAIRPEVERLDVPLHPDEEAVIPVVLRARRPLIGTGTARPYTVSADVEDRAGEVGAEAQPFVEQVRAEGVFQQSARINGRVLTTLGMLLPVIAILVAAWILRPQTEPEILSGPLSFGVAGVVERLEVRPNEFILAGDRIATMSATEPQLALAEAQLALRRAIVDLEGMKTQHLAEQAEAALGEEEATTEPDPDFLEALVQELQIAVESALAVSTTSLTGLTDALNTYCASAEERPTECDTQPVPLPSAFVAALVDQAATNPAARDVVDANANYRSSTATLQTVQALLSDAEARFEAVGGDADAVPPPPADGEDGEDGAALLAAAQSEQAATEYELSLLEQQAVIAEAQLACRAALQDVGRTVLRAPVDLFVVEVLVTPGAEVEGDASIVIVERTDGRLFTPPPGLRAPDPQDLPDDSCPGTIEELRASDEATQDSAIQKSTQSSPRLMAELRAALDFR